ncbi:hypothetical protein [Phormidium tenue]|uniref:Uncharacterized protein n=1 Tax=Phormidium tenue FACHB-1050 TaxID=2692857 RepID=A0ABR8CG11_9CYAN|nr:hypothetical protein [Phormidium tenue]MBD2319644.1 hypothetical protein [Phormidium tenue FACHB-1050]
MSTITQLSRLTSRHNLEKDLILITSRVKEVRSKAMSVFHFGGFIFKFYAGSIAVLVLANALSTL